ncbi:MAG: hypothetical protein IPM77_09575 [Crocinitomicaceae bacterium]|nr:hypothetical protein [Crocinitomicaceae bacterium]
METLLQKEIETVKFKAKMIEPGLIENYIKPGVNIDVADAWEIKKSNMELTNGNSYAVLVVSGHLSSVTKGAREVVASRQFVGKTIAKALLVDSLGHRLVGNFYLTVNKPLITTKIFTDREAAINWLRTLIV